MVDHFGHGDIGVTLSGEEDAFKHSTERILVEERVDVEWTKVEEASGFTRISVGAV